MYFFKNLVIFIFFLYLYVGYRYMFIYNNNKDIVTFIDKKDIKTGDIIILNFNKNNVFTDGIFGFKFYHAAIALWENEELYFIEYAWYNDKKEGIIKHHYSEFSYYNIDSVMMLNKLVIKDDSEEKRKKLSHDILKFYETVKKVKDIEPGFGLGWYRFLTQHKDKYKPLNFEESKNVTCLEILSCLLCEIGIVKKNKSISYLPTKFINMEGFDFEKNYSYDKNFLCNLSFY